MALPGQEAREQRMLAAMRDEGARVVEQAQTMQHPGLDRMPGGHHPHCQVLRGGGIQDLGHAQTPP